MSMYLSSLYGPVYLVSHTVTMYMMPELGLKIALKSTGDGDKTSEKSKAQHEGFPVVVFFSSSSSTYAKTGDSCVSDCAAEKI